MTHWEGSRSGQWAQDGWGCLHWAGLTDSSSSAVKVEDRAKGAGLGAAHGRHWGLSARRKECTPRPQECSSRASGLMGSSCGQPPSHLCTWGLIPGKVPPPSLLPLCGHRRAPTALGRGPSLQELAVPPSSLKVFVLLLHSPTLTWAGPGRCSQYRARPELLPAPSTPTGPSPGSEPLRTPDPAAGQSSGVCAEHPPQAGSRLGQQERRQVPACRGRGQLG